MTGATRSTLDLPGRPIRGLGVNRVLAATGADYSGRVAAGPVVKFVLLTSGANRMVHPPGQVEHVPKVGIADGVTQRYQPELTALATATLPNVTPKRHARPTADYEVTAA